MNKAHLELKKVAIAIGAVVSLGMATSTLAASDADMTRMKTGSSLKPKVNMEKSKMTIQKCIAGFSRNNNSYGYSCVSNKASCTAPFVVKNLHVEGKKFAYVCMDPAKIPK